ncbi:hypothetical protein [Geminisphaera colitermitum]|nr:hypothetical protein [Geminisphaera colitermitum]
MKTAEIREQRSELKRRYKRIQRYRRYRRQGMRAESAFMLIKANSPLFP